MTQKKRIAVIAGDGIGKEVIPQALKAVQAAGAAVEFTEFDWGADRYLADKTTVPPDVKLPPVPLTAPAFTIKVPLLALDALKNRMLAPRA